MLNHGQSGLNLTICTKLDTFFHIPVLSTVLGKSFICTWFCSTGAQYKECKTDERRHSIVLAILGSTREVLIESLLQSKAHIVQVAASKLGTQLIPAKTSSPWTSFLTQILMLKLRIDQARNHSCRQKRPVGSHHI